MGTLKVLKILNLAFGRCDHQITCDILQKDYDNYKITWSDEGY